MGVPVHNAERHVEEALRSILGQASDRLAVVVVDDVSSDRSPEIIREVAGDQAVVERSDRPLGLVGAWRRAFELALERHPDAEYFAWGSDHDVWEPAWLESLAQALDAHPEAVFAWPLLDAIDEDGAPFKRGIRWFNTAGVDDPIKRIRMFATTRRAGDMVYGLYRIAALRRVGAFPFILQPDRAFLARLALEGQFLQIEEVLWHRRYRRGVVPTMRRQRLSLWGGSPPLWARVPWRIQHWVWLVRSVTDEPFLERAKIATIYAVTLRWAIASKARKDRMRRRKRWRKRWKHRIWLLRERLRGR
jgi:glycosyltransferase involved in cell wall biosynthesis